MRSMFAQICCLAMAVCSPLLAEESSGALPGDWCGDLQLGPMELTIVLHLDEKLKGTVDCIEQGAFGVPVENLSLSDNQLRFDLKEWKASFEATLHSEKQELVGKMKQLGLSIPLTLKRGAAKPLVLNRPQEPKAPFPYGVEEVSYRNVEDGAILSATLTLPDTDSPCPAVLLIAGSGPNDRDETIFGHKPFLLLADHLTRKGFAVLRQDKRGVGKSTGSFEKATFVSFADDALKAIAYLKSRKEIDPRRIGLIGHSEGGMIAPMVAAESKDVAFLVLMAAPAVTGDEILYEQSALMQRADGASEEAIQVDRHLREQLIQALKEYPDPEEGKKEWHAIIARHLRDNPPPECPNGIEFSPESAEQMVELYAKSWNWLRHFVLTDPAVFLREVQAPILVLNGSLDLQVSARQNLPVIEAALTAADNKDFKIVELPQLNHLFQTCKSGSVTEYAKIEETISPDVLTLISNWLLEKANAPQVDLLQDKFMMALGSMRLMAPSIGNPSPLLEKSTAPVLRDPLFGNPEKSVSDKKRGIRSFRWDYDEGEEIVYVRDTNDSPWRELLRRGAEERGHPLSFSEDNESIYLISSMGANAARPLKISLLDGTYEILAEEILVE